MAKSYAASNRAAGAQLLTKSVSGSGVFDILSDAGDGCSTPNEVSERFGLSRLEYTGWSFCAQLLTKSVSGSASFLPFPALYMLCSTPNEVSERFGSRDICVHLFYARVLNS